MIRIALAGLLGAIVLFGWDLLGWQVLKLQEAILKPLPNEAAVMNALGPDGQEGGFYFGSGSASSPAEVTAGTREEGASTLQRLKDWKYTGILMRGPARSDLERDAALTFMVYLVSALIAAFLLAEAVAPAQSGDPLARYRYRLAFVTGLGILAAFVTDLPYWIWLGFDAGYTWFMVGYRAAAWLLVGVFMSGLITPTTRSLLEMTASPSKPGNAPEQPQSQSTSS